MALCDIGGMSQAKRLRRRHKKAPTEEQRGFGFAAGVEGRRVAPQKDAIPKARLPSFEEPDPYAVTINGRRLSDYLRATGEAWVVELVDLLFGLDWRMFFSSYKPSGRPPIHPRIIMGLLVYGTLRGRTSLREFETLASLDLGAWFVCGGLQPDHSTVGKFLQRHADILTKDFFEELTTDLLSRLKLAPGVAAVDGTVVAAVSSRLSTLKLEAAREAAKATAAQVSTLEKSMAPADAGTRTAEPAAPMLPPKADLSPDDSSAPGQSPTSPTSPAAPETTKSPGSAALAEARARAAEAAEVLRVAEARVPRAGDPKRTTVVPGELDAVLLPLKTGSIVPAYKPSIAVHESGLIVGQAVDPTSEVAVVPALREQHRRILGTDPVRTLFDAGYHCLEILQAFADQDVLCPAGTLRQDFVKRGRGGMFAKTSFVYDENTDSFRCPGGQTLARITNKLVDPNGPYVNYRAASACCAKCALKARCTKSKARTVSRWDGDEFKEAMAQVMAQPRARAAFKRRAVIVEPVFAHLKERQRLRRFRRRGLRKVRMEFALHCIVFNIGRALSLERRRLVVFFCWSCLEGFNWRLMVVGAWLP